MTFSPDRWHTTCSVQRGGILRLFIPTLALVACGGGLSVSTTDVEPSALIHGHHGFIEVDGVEFIAITFTDREEICDQPGWRPLAGDQRWDFALLGALDESRGVQVDIQPGATADDPTAEQLLATFPDGVGFFGSLHHLTMETDEMGHLAQWLPTEGTVKVESAGTALNWELSIDLEGTMDEGPASVRGQASSSPCAEELWDWWPGIDG